MIKRLLQDIPPFVAWLKSKFREEQTYSTEEVMERIRRLRQG